MFDVNLRAMMAFRVIGKGHMGLQIFLRVHEYAATDTGKCLSYECLVKTCKACEMWVPRKGSIEYENFIKEHNAQ